MVIFKELECAKNPIWLYYPHTSTIQINVNHITDIEEGCHMVDYDTSVIKETKNWLGVTKKEKVYEPGTKFLYGVWFGLNGNRRYRYFKEGWSVEQFKEWVNT